jgi:membrane protein DedA with SNARE-associated domain
MNFFVQVFSDRTGKPSHLRLASFTWVFGILFSIVYLVIKNGNFPVIPNEVLLTVVGVLAVKAYQKGKEEIPSEPNK